MGAGGGGGSNTVASARSVGGGGVTLDSLVETDRIEGHMWAIWLRILRSREGSRLRLREARHKVHRELLAAILCASAEGANVSRSRLDFLGKVDSKAAYLQRTATGSDLFLDTDSYSAHSTALDTLWAGVPLLTFPRQTFASRVPCSFLDALGSDALIARNVEEYEKIATKLVSAPAVLSRWRERLWEQRLSARGLFNEPRMLVSLHLAFRMVLELAWGLGADKRMHLIVYDVSESVSF